MYYEIRKYTIITKKVPFRTPRQPRNPTFVSRSVDQGNTFVSRSLPSVLRRCRIFEELPLPRPSSPGARGRGRQSLPLPLHPRGAGGLLSLLPLPLLTPCEAGGRPLPVPFSSLSP